MIKGYLSFVLHGHMPWVLEQGTWPHGEVWLHEAAAETYLPTLSMLTNLHEKKGYTNVLTLGMTPVLTEQLVHPSFKAGFETYLDDRIEQSYKDKDHFNWIGESKIAQLAERWIRYYSSVKEQFVERFNRDLVEGYNRLQDKGVIEIITCGVTHGYLPLLGKEEMVNAQIKGGQSIYQHRYGRESTGIWLPELAYRPAYRWKNPITDEEIDRLGVEYYLAKNSIRYFLVDTPLLRGGEGIGTYLDKFDALKKLWAQFEKQKPDLTDKDYSLFRPYFAGGTEDFEHKVSFFTRDDKTGVLVWSGDIGFPGDANYLEFHKKHWPSGNRYWKVTGKDVDLGEKEVYDHNKIIERLDENSEHFFNVAKESIIQNYADTGVPGIVTCPYDFELFGHWWFEAVGFLERIITKLNEDDEIATTTTRNYLAAYPPSEDVYVSLPEGSWGKGNFHWIWLNDDTTLSWKYIYECEDLYLKALKEFKETHYKDFNLAKRLVNQLGRELLLLSSSDWTFLISTWSARDYAEVRIKLHYDNFKKLYVLFKQYKDGKINDQAIQLLAKMEKDDSIAWEQDVYQWFEI